MVVVTARARVPDRSPGRQAECTESKQKTYDAFFTDHCWITFQKGFRRIFRAYVTIARAEEERAAHPFPLPPWIGSARPEHAGGVLGHGAGPGQAGPSMHTDIAN